ncbi:MAG TPA: D-amino acid aminotransferase [Steroidobacteraceae bacterium]|nr:D-amino acid aminotransferase [Steroidobacteraceae bacterium]
MADPLPISYLNGAFVPLQEARISPLDRGFLYSDGVYELMPVYEGRPFRFEAHADRLTRSLAGIQMEDPHTRSEWREIFSTLITRNGGGNLYIYWQVTRGAELGRNHAPLPKVPRTVFAFCAPLPVVSPTTLENGVECITTEDTRWAHCDIKSVSLLANILLRQQAIDAGAAEIILLKDGQLREASSSAVHVVIDGVIVSPPRSRAILPGTTRSAMEEVATSAGLTCQSEPVSEQQLRAAQEIWISAATREVQPVTRLDGKPVGTGKPGPVWRRIHEQWQRYKRGLQGQPW